MFILNPPTAKVRKLNLGGLQPANVWRFLKEVQQVAGLKQAGISLQHLFDTVEASEIGIFYVLTLFIEGWNFGDCKHHLPNLKGFKHTKSRVTFGQGLSWNLPQYWRYNGSKIMLDSSNRIIHVAEDPSPLRPALTVRYHGETYTSAQVNKIAMELFCSLFYLELRHPPEFYISPDNCMVEILCRIPPSSELLRTLLWLHTNRVRVNYKGHASSWSEAVLCTEDELYKCSEGQPFSRTVNVSVHSLDTKIQIRLGPFHGTFHDISGSPNKLGHFLQLQQQGWQANSQGRTRREEKMGRGYSGPLELELDGLIEAIRLTL